MPLCKLNKNHRALCIILTQKLGVQVWETGFGLAVESQKSESSHGPFLILSCMAKWVSELDPQDFRNWQTTRHAIWGVKSWRYLYCDHISHSSSKHHHFANRLAAQAGWHTPTLFSKKSFVPLWCSSPSQIIRRQRRHNRSFCFRPREGTLWFSGVCATASEPGSRLKISTGAARDSKRQYAEKHWIHWIGNQKKYDLLIGGFNPFVNLTCWQNHPSNRIQN